MGYQHFREPRAPVWCATWRLRDANWKLPIDKGFAYKCRRSSALEMQFNEVKETRVLKQKLICRKRDLCNWSIPEQESISKNHQELTSHPKRGIKQPLRYKCWNVISVISFPCYELITKDWGGCVWISVVGGEGGVPLTPAVYWLNVKWYIYIFHDSKHMLDIYI